MSDTLKKYRMKVHRTVEQFVEVRAESAGNAVRYATSELGVKLGTTTVLSNVSLRCEAIAESIIEMPDDD